MLITRKSLFSGVTRTIDLPITSEQLMRWDNGECIQNAFPHLDADQREFLLTGATKEEWDEMFGNEDGE